MAEVIDIIEGLEGAGAAGAIADVGGVAAGAGDVLGNLAGEAGGVLGDVGAAAENLGGVVGGGLAAGADAAAGAVDAGANAAAGAVDAGVDAAAAAAEAAEALPRVADGLATTIKNAAISAGKFAVVEVAKGAAMGAGFLGIEKLLSSSPATPQNSAAHVLFEADNSAYTNLNTAVTGWHQFVAANASAGPSAFGSVTVEGMTFTRFGLFVSALATYDQFNTATIPPALTAAKNNPSESNLRVLANVLSQSAKKALVIANNIVANQQAMVQAGLKPDVDDIQSAIKTLSSVQN